MKPGALGRLLMRAELDDSTEKARVESEEKSRELSRAIIETTRDTNHARAVFYHLARTVSYLFAYLDRPSDESDVEL